MIEEIMPDNYDRRRGGRPNYPPKPSQGQQNIQRGQPEKAKRTGDRGPYFLPKLLNQEITIHLTDGHEVRGKLKGFNSYELLIEPAELMETSEMSLVFRSAIVKVSFRAELMGPKVSTE